MSELSFCTVLPRKLRLCCWAKVNQIAGKLCCKIFCETALAVKQGLIWKPSGYFLIVFSLHYSKTDKVMFQANKRLTVVKKCKKEIEHKVECILS